VVELVTAGALCVVVVVLAWAVVKVAVRSAALAHPAPAAPVEAPAPRRPGWMDSDGAQEWPVDVLVQFADPDELRQAHSHRERVDLLRQSIALRGQDLPVVLVVDTRSRCRLADGHHRLASLLELGEPAVGVVIRPSTVIQGWGRPVVDLICSLVDYSSSGQSR
jgi:hypothetical protein